MADYFKSADKVDFGGAQGDQPEMTEEQKVEYIKKLEYQVIDKLQLNLLFSEGNEL